VGLFLLILSRNKQNMSELTSDEQLVVCNLTSVGVSLKDAIARVKNQRPQADECVDGEKPKLSTKERKELLADEINALDGEVPPMNASIAKFEEALTAAKATLEETDDLM
jgi:hypothetical protein